MSTDLFSLISRIETKNDTHAIRFEPVFFNSKPKNPDLIAKIKQIHNCSFGTAGMLYSCSFGAVQMMGFNLWGETCGYGGTFLDYLLNQNDQRDTFDKFLNANGLSQYSPDLLAGNLQARLKFAKAYNGSADYVSPMIEALNYYGYQVTV